MSVTSFAYDCCRCFLYYNQALLNSFSTPQKLVADPLHGIQYFRNSLFGYSSYKSQAAAFCKVFKVSQIADAKIVVEQPCSFMADAAYSHQVEDGDRHFLFQDFKRFAGSGVDDLNNLCAYRLANRRDFLEPGHPFLPYDVCHLLRIVFDRISSRTIRTNLERIIVFELHQVGDLPENVCN